MALIPNALCFAADALISLPFFGSRAIQINPKHLPEKIKFGLCRGMCAKAPPNTADCAACGAIQQEKAGIFQACAACPNIKCNPHQQARPFVPALLPKAHSAKRT